MIMVKAHAKINAALNVNEKLDNGYHNIDTIMLPLELHDRIEFEFLPDDFDNYITCDDISIPTDESNLAIKAFQKVVEKYDIKKKFRIHIHKIIPISAGLGGGSADAAVVINTVLKMMKIKVSDEEKIELAKSVGADVPFCLFNRASRCKGIGEKLEFINFKSKYYCLIVKPKIGVSTKKAYENYDSLLEKEYSNIDRLEEGFKMDDEKIIKEEMKNGLEKAVFNEIPEIAEIKNKMIDDGFNMSLMSGSGSSVYCLSKSLKALQNEANKFDNKKFYVKVTSII